MTPGSGIVPAAAVLAASLLSAPAMADEDARARADLRACLAAGAGTGAAARACIGVVTDPCQDAGPGGQTTLGMVDCLRRETRAWDRLLDEEYAAATAWAQVEDDAERPLFPEFAARAEALRTAQAAWVAFRDAECRLAYAAWGAGSIRSIAGAVCHRDMTAERAIALKALREGLE